ncbi:MAG: S1C family serine protease, partial [Chloroflexota bacterium]|nr:S1C family serine protease [Chloroflexota bacterium]
MRIRCDYLHRWLPILLLTVLFVLGQSLNAWAAPTHQAATPTPRPPRAGKGAGQEESILEANASAAAITLEEAQAAVIQIEAVGTFISREEGMQMNAAGLGSGFIIDPDGIAVTNNHVATGAAFLKVYVAGEDEPRNARILGVSECSDLAVIDIEGDGFPYLAWYEGTVKVGLDVYALGFP